MAKYEVVRAWHGVKVGDVVETDKLHPALKPNVRKLQGATAAQLTPALSLPIAGVTKDEVAKRLKELDIEFDGRKGLDELQALLPDGDPLKPKAE